MTEAEFNLLLRRKLSGLPERDVEVSIEYYNELIADRVEDGLSEEEAVAALGPIDVVVAEILAAIPTQEPPAKAARPHRPLKAWEIILLILGSPVWLPILAAAVCIVLSVYITLWAGIIVLYSALLSLALGSVFGIISAILMAVKGGLIQGLFFAGLSLCCAGLSIFLFFISVHATKYLVILGKKMFSGIILFFRGKERQQ